MKDILRKAQRIKVYKMRFNLQPMEYEALRYAHILELTTNFVTFRYNPLAIFSFCL